MPRHTPDEEEAYREAQHGRMKDQFRTHEAYREAHAVGEY